MFSGNGVKFGFDTWYLKCRTNSYTVGKELAPAEKDGTSKPVPYKNVIQ